MSLESLRFMLGGAIHRPSSAEPVLVRHTEEVVVGEDGKVPVPTDHLTGYAFDGTNAPAITASEDYPVKLINLTKGTRTQLTEGTFTANSTITFKNPAMIGETAQAAVKGDHIRVFWTEVINSEEGVSNESAIEVTISPDTLKSPGEVSLIKITNCWKLLKFLTYTIFYSIIRKNWTISSQGV